MQVFHGLQLDGTEGIPEDVRKNLGALVRFMRDHQVTLLYFTTYFISYFTTYFTSRAASVSG